MNYNGFECKKNNGIWTKCENENIFTIIPAGASPAI